MGVQAVRVSAHFLSTKCRAVAGIDGEGSCALEPIAAGETVAAFGGHCLSGAALGEGRSHPPHAVQIDEDVFLVAGPDTPARDLVAHSCSPNCGIVGGVLVVAMRDIAAGETLSFDHAMTMGCELDAFACACGAATCRQLVTGRDWMLPELQIAYRGYFSAYLAKRIAGLVRTGAERRAFAI